MFLLCVFFFSSENSFIVRRTMELLTRNWNLSKKLRIPAISRLQKMHNVDIVFEILKSRGVQLNDELGKNCLTVKLFFSLKIDMYVYCANGLSFHLQEIQSYLRIL